MPRMFRAVHRPIIDDPRTGLQISDRQPYERKVGYTDGNLLERRVDA